MNAATIIIRFLLSVILFRAALHKARDPIRFQSELKAYRLLPESLLSSAAFGLILMEAFAAMTLLNNSWPFPALLAAVLFSVYAIAMAINLFKGRANIDCGCNGPLLSTKAVAKKTISWVLVIRNILLAAFALLCAYPHSEQTLLTIDRITILFGSLATLLLYEAIEQAITNAQNTHAWHKHRVQP